MDDNKKQLRQRHRQLTSRKQRLSPSTNFIPYFATPLITLVACCLPSSLAFLRLPTSSFTALQQHHYLSTTGLRHTRHVFVKSSLWSVKDSECEEDGFKEDEYEFEDEETEIRNKLREADEAIAAAVEAREKLIRFVDDRKNKKADSVANNDIPVSVNVRQEKSRKEVLLSISSSKKKQKRSPSFLPGDDENLNDIPSPPPWIKSHIEYTDAGTLLITVPPKGVGPGILFSGAFSTAWFASIIPATLSVRKLASIPFLIPFYLVGGVMAKNTVLDPFKSGSLSIGKFAYCIENRVYARRQKGGIVVSSREGPTKSLKGEANIEIVVVINGKPNAEIRLYDDVKGKTISFGLGLSINELEYLADVINEHLGKIRREEQDYDYDDEDNI